MASPMTHPHDAPHPCTHAHARTPDIDSTRYPEPFGSIVTKYHQLGDWCLDTAVRSLPSRYWDVPLFAALALRKKGSEMPGGFPRS